MNKPNRPRAIAIGVSLAAALLAATGPAGALEAKISGHVNRVLMGVDDGTETKLFNADNINSQTRFRFTGTQEIWTGLKAGILWEVGFTSNPSNALSFTNRSAAATFNERHVDAFLVGNWGKLSLGQGDGAANGAMEVDLSGTAVINYSSQTDIGAAFNFRNGATFGPTIGSTIDNLDFESRYDRLRYDTPMFGPVYVAVSFGTKGNANVTEVAGWYSSALGGGKLAAALGWSRREAGGATGNEDTVGGSISWLAANGLNLTLAYANRDNDNPLDAEKKYVYGKLGYKAGLHAVSVDYGRGKDFGVSGRDSSVFGIGYVYTPRNWIELYAGAKRHSLDQPGTSFDDVTFLMAGTRIKF
ncbi:MAG: porin [Burkholderiaceae bacterium]